MKKKNYLLFKTFLAVLAMISLSLNVNLKADEVIVGQGNANTGNAWPYYPFYTGWGVGTGEYLVTAAEISAAGGAAGIINKIGMQFKTIGDMTWNWGNFKIRLLNYNQNSLPAHGTRTAFLPGYTDVYQRTNWTAASTYQPGQSSYAVNDWMMFTLDTPFEYTGGSLVVGICYWSTNTWNSSIGGLRATQFPDGEKVFFRYYDNQPNSPCGWFYYNHSLGYNYFAYRPDFKLDIAMGGYNSSNCFQLTGYAGAGATNVPIMGVKIGIGNKEAPYQYLKSVTFGAKNSVNLTPQQISKARVFLTKDSVFSTSAPAATQIGGDLVVTPSNKDNLLFTLTTPIRLYDGKNFLWLVYDVNTDCPDNSTIDGQLVNFVLHTCNASGVFQSVTPISPAPTNMDPAGEKIVRQPLSKGVYLVGPGVAPEDGYTTLAQCATEFSMIGVTKNTLIKLTGDINDTNMAVFGPCPYGDKIVITMRPDSGKQITLSNTSSDSTKSIIRLAGVKHFYIEGSSSDTTVHDLTIKRTSKGSAIVVLNSEDVKIKDTKIEGSSLTTNATIFNNTSGIELVNNLINKSYSGFIFADNSSGIYVYGNTIGDNAKSSANTCSNGFIFTTGSNSATVAHNKILNLIGGNEGAESKQTNTTAFRLSTASGITLYNNIVTNISTKSETSAVSGLELYDSKNIFFAHNTVFIGNLDSKYNTRMVDILSSNSSVNISNNLFSYNALNPKSNFYGVYTNPTSVSLICDNNVYNGHPILVFAAPSSNVGISGAWNFAYWKGTSKDRNSKSPNYIASFISETDSDYHIDGMIVGQPEMLIPTISGVTTDIDDIQRGQSLLKPGYTTPGADEAMLKVSFNLSNKNLPSLVENCEDEENEVLYKREINFSGWEDGIVRSTHPQSYNFWYRSDNVLLDSTNGFNTSIYPYLYIAKPVYTLSCSLRVVSRLGYISDTSNWSKLLIIKLPRITKEPEPKIMTCINSGHVTVPVSIYGSYVSLQWEKKSGSVWQPLAGQTSASLNLNFGNNVSELNGIKGIYRLRINPYPGKCNAPVAVYSTPCEVNGGFPLTRANLSLSHDRTNLLELCNKEYVWFAASIPAGDSALITGYQWEKWNSDLNKFEAISSAVNPSAVSDTFRLLSTRQEDGGLYRCLILGIDACLGGDKLPTDTVRIKVTPSMEIIKQPVELSTCISKSNVSLETLISEVSSDITPNKYQWYKDGVVLDSIRKLKSDTTVLVFDTIKLTDGGRYKLRIIYINCKGVLDTTFTDEVSVYVFDKTEIINQSHNVYGIRGGYLHLFVEAITSGSTTASPISYQWYRHRKDDVPLKLQNSNRISGVNTPILTIAPITDDDLSVLENTPSPTDYYFCAIKGLCNTDSVVTSPMLIKVAPEIQINSQPIGLNKCEGNNAEFSVVATPTEPTEPIAYQWYRNDVALVNDAVFSGVASDKLTVTGIRSIDAGSYKVAIKYTKLDAGIYSDVAVLNVETAPVISKVTQDTTVEEGNTLILSVEVADQPNAIYEYQWYKDNIELPQSNESVYLVSTATKDDEGVYKVIVKSLNGCGDVTSSVINVKIATGIFDNNTDPNFKILSVLPNPVSLEATVNFMLPDNQFARLYLTDMHGRNVSLFEGVCASGLNSVKISDTLKNFSNGTYFIILESKGRKVAYSITINK